MSSSFSFASERVCGSLARIGTLSIPSRKTLETPAMLIDTKAGAVPHLTRDVVSSKLGTGSFGLNLNLGHLIRHPGSEGLKKMGQTIQEFASLGDIPTFLSVQDASNPIPHEYNENRTVSVWDSAGRRKVSVHTYAEFVTQSKPDLFESLSDTLQTAASSKRTEKSVRRSIDHLDNLISAIGPDSHTGLFACVEGGDLMEKRVAMAKVVSHLPVAGFAMNGITEGTYCHDRSLLASLLQSILTELPPAKPRLLHNVGSPALVLTAVSCGVDLFDGSYLNKLKESKIAVRIPIEESSQEKLQTFTTSEKIMISVSDDEFKDCFQPLQQGCPCYTCANYACAYLHHLHATKEMLLPMLLMIHNINQYQRFFAHIREHLKKQTFNEFQKRIELLTQNQKDITSSI